MADSAEKQPLEGPKRPKKRSSPPRPILITIRSEQGPEMRHLGERGQSLFEYRACPWVTSVPVELPVGVGVGEKWRGEEDSGKSRQLWDYPLVPRGQSQKSGYTKESQLRLPLRGKEVPDGTSSL